MFAMLAATSVCTVMVVCHGFVLEPPGTGQPSVLSASSDPFIGKWKLNPSRSNAGDEMKVVHLGPNKCAFDFGTGSLETIILNGTDQPGESGSTLAVSIEGPNRWKVVRKVGGHTAIFATWELSRNGKTLIDHLGSVQPDGSIKRTDYIYKRTSGRIGFLGTWESTTSPASYEIQVERYEGDGLSFINSTQKLAKSLKFDGRDYPVAGPNMPSGYASSGHRVNAHTLQLAESIAGKPLDTQQAELSADLKTLTMTVRPSGQGKERILVFDRE